MDDKQLQEMIATLIGISDIVYGEFTFSYDLLCDKVDDVQKKILITKANECGCFWADRLLEQLHIKEYKDKMQYMTDGLDLRIEYKERLRGGDRLVFAQFENPNRITIFLDSIQAAQSAITEQNLTRLVGNVSVSEVILAHEIFHYIEEKNKHEIFTRQYKVDLWSLKIFKNQSTIRCLSEIAAMAFAKKLLNLSYSPFVFDVLVAYSLDHKLGEKLYSEVLKYA
ncbi:MAG TPA: hypothetical protein IAC62_08130 [Candidatus Pelethocola excrementipullorum]|nr:hypothetical protein [Candidatus Pelethocola excrementipullorum]